MNTKEAIQRYSGLWWTKYTPRQLDMIEDVAASHPTPIRYKGTAEKTVKVLECDGLVKGAFDLQLDALHKGRSRRIWIVSATEKLLALERRSKS
jgi:hypothetical protein